MTDARAFRVPVTGGMLAGGIWDPAGSPTVVAIHGITATHLSWPFVARALNGIRVVAPDLRGRGRSNTLPGPWNLPRLADDVVAMMDAREIERAPILGHSMGAFVGVWLAHRHPDRVSSLTLIDGGLPIPRAAGGDPLALLGPAADRLRQTFATRAAYREFWKAHPAFAGDWSADVEAYVDYDLDGEEPLLTAATPIEAVAENIMELNGDGGYREALTALSLPIDFLWAPRGLLNEPTALYSPVIVSEYASLIPSLTVHAIDDVNHYTSIMSEHGASQVAAIVTARISH
ncbi:alpha/beta fold hydrolase [Glaciibacter psychrotolerans]|uniref:Pimeloyl-ACP methyl ester carboxylesterase n=1 Tax=Glaciibacter psychrotolerans TaxID=670054 RepID=A0A7Z0J6K2_9MICO|nr:alpha/beta fold hydrolase [Leifsonia psychrotolerans]NYJ20033.1 pimeloyl-ACP methyl ester carboxylesterase [Leifsonia psychrotolerans]